MRASDPPPVMMNVAYNVPREQFLAAFGDPDAEGRGRNGAQRVAWYCSTYEPPWLEPEEAWEASYGAADRAAELLMEQDFPLWNELHDDLVCTARGGLPVYTDRRCIHLELRSERALTHETVAGLQRWLAARFPLHRIELPAPRQEDWVVIYPKLVQVGPQTVPFAAPLEPALASNRQRRFLSRSGRSVYTASQFMAVKGRFRSVWNATPAHGAAVVAAFDSLRGKAQAALWLLIRGALRPRPQAALFPAFPEARWNQTFAIDADGRLGDSGVDASSEAWLCEYGFPAEAAQAPFEVEVDGVRFTLPAQPLLPTPFDLLARLQPE